MTVNLYYGWSDTKTLLKYPADLTPATAAGVGAELMNCVTKSDRYLPRHFMINEDVTDAAITAAGYTIRIVQINSTPEDLYEKGILHV